MSDFVYSSSRKKQGELSLLLDGIYELDGPECIEFHGPWGSLAVTPTRYKGFQPVECEDYICVVVGGPVLYFTDNDFSSSGSSSAGTYAILERWRVGSLNWSDDLSGPFVVLVIDKINLVVDCITDLMLFIPVYQYSNKGDVCWGTHVDSLAKACNQHHQYDEVALADFILHHAVTYPYTVYRDIYQLQPASITHLTITSDSSSCLDEPCAYWEPVESSLYSNINEAANALEMGVSGYIERIVSPLDTVAQFISAGEDSRALAGILPQHLKRDAYIFLDSMNREGRIATRIASAYGEYLSVGYRTPSHYIDILSEASLLVGMGHQYRHAHSMRFDKIYNLSSYNAVFGGYFADSLLKGEYSRKFAFIKKIKFLPQFSLSGESRTNKVINSVFPDEILQQINNRRSHHYNRIACMRPSSSHEWFELWPATMRFGMPNFYVNRRLFASYEIFMSNDAVKVAASVPVSWKLNHRLFRSAFKQYLFKSMYIPHADGRFPYFPWWVNTFVQPPVWIFQELKYRLGGKKKYEGPWVDWRSLVSSSEWDHRSSYYKANGHPVPILDNILEKGLLDRDCKELSEYQKVNLLQACVSCSR